MRSLAGDERDQVVADLTETLDSLRATAARLRPPGHAADARTAVGRAIASRRGLEPGEVQLQASWSAGQVVVWAAGRGATPESHDELSARLEAIGGPPLGWQLHPGVQLPGGLRADALAIPMKDALGWLVAVGGGHGRDGVGASCAVARATSRSRVFAWRRPGRSCRRCVSRQRPQAARSNAAVRWRPALVDSPAIAALAAAMPATVAAIDGGRGPAVDDRRDHGRGRGDRRRERRAHGAAGRPADGDARRRT